MRATVPFSMLLAAVFWPGSASADRTFRCSTGRLVNVGDEIPVVLVACGAPAYSVRWSESVQAAVEARSATRHRFSRTVEVRMEQWVYDVGPGRLLRLLTFRDGLLVGIRTLNRYSPGGA